MNIDVIWDSIDLNSVFDTLKYQTENIANILLELFLAIKLTISSATKSLRSPIEFTDLQFSLLKVFTFVFIVNLILIAIYWRKYGTIITDRFIRPSTLKEIEELKLSVAKLKLPKEHTPRI